MARSAFDRSAAHFVRAGFCGGVGGAGEHAAFRRALCSRWFARGWLVFEWVRDRAAIGMILRSAVLPMALLLIPVAAWMAYYNYRVTGHALELPYVAHDRQYALLEPVLWQTHVRPEPAYSNAFLRDFWQADLR